MAHPTLKNSELKNAPWMRLFPEGGFSEWKKSKENAFKTLNAAPQIRLERLESPESDSVQKIKYLCSQVNFAVYETDEIQESVEETGKKLLKFAAHFGLSLKESHRSASEDGVVALTPSSEKSKQGYIPYTPKALNWHTDGYYNPPETPVKAFILHCHTQADVGGVNELIDPEVAFMRLYEADPKMAAAFFHPEAMTIPANVEKNGNIRPASIGPVFFFDGTSGRLQMRYTARTRSIEWRQDTATQEAADWMRDWLVSDEVFKIRIKLKAGQGILNNNALHNRTGFEDDPGKGARRIMLRVRFHDRIEEN
jgi:hypothetical protein